MKNRWREFEGRPNRLTKRQPGVTLNHKGVFLLNAMAIAALGEPEAVALIYDEDESTIGIRPTDPRRINAFPVVKKKLESQQSFRIVNGSPFCRHFGIKISTTVRFNNVEIDNDGVMLLPLKFAVKTGRGIY
jgi:hypothetical protein